jgi:hypothetical protein
MTTAISSPNGSPTQPRSNSSSEQRELEFQRALVHKEWLKAQLTRELLAHLSRRRESLLQQAESAAAAGKPTEQLLLAARELRLLQQNINDGKYE